MTWTKISIPYYCSSVVQIFHVNEKTEGKLSFLNQRFRIIKTDANNERSILFYFYRHTPSIWLEQVLTMAHTPSYLFIRQWDSAKDSSSYQENCCSSETDVGPLTNSTKGAYPGHSIQSIKLLSVALLVSALVAIDPPGSKP